MQAINDVQNCKQCESKIRVFLLFFKPRASRACLLIASIQGFGDFLPSLPPVGLNVQKPVSVMSAGNKIELGSGR